MSSIFIPATLAQSTQSLVFIDAQVNDVAFLLKGIQPGTEAIILHPNQDGVAQITAALQVRPFVHTVHIVAHASPGCLQLGNTHLSLDTLNHYAPQLKTWFSPLHLTPHRLASAAEPTLHLYACNLAAGDAGEEFLTKLHHLTGASIAASAEIVGNPKQGGTWQLTAHRGTHTPEVAFAASVTQHYAGVFSLSFASAANFAVGVNPASVAVGDFNGDGKADLVVNSNTVSVLLNTSNAAPTDLALSPSSVAENSAIGTVVGSFTTTDAEGGSFTYTLVDGANFPDNAAFTITGNQLTVNAAFNFEADNSYSVKVRTTDQDGLFYVEEVTVAITDVNEAPDAVNDSFLGNQTTPLVISATTLLSNDIDPDAGTVLRVSAVGSAVGGTVSLNTNGTPANFADDFVTFTPTTSFSGNASFVYTLSDGSLTDTATVTIAASRTVNGSSNDDTLNGTPGNDIFAGGNGQDRLTGLAGNDRLDGGDGDDRLDGGADNDFLSGGNGQDILLGGTGVDTLNGGSGDDRLDGGADNDLLTGGSGQDILLGGTGRDTLNGGSGGDRLLGGLGNDTLTGGDNNDTFVLAAGSGTDRVTDFVDNSDRIGLTAGLVFSQLTISAGTGSNAGSTLITRTSTSEVLAILTGIQSNKITSNDFVTV